MLMVQALEVSLRLETFPKSEIDVFALVLEQGGGMVGAAITAASLALADAGVEMYDLVASCSVVRFTPNSFVINFIWHIFKLN
jgi:exosome complex component MTR3